MMQLTRVQIWSCRTGSQPPAWMAGFAIAVLLLATFVSPTAAADKITLRLASGVGVKHYLSTEGDQYLAARATELSGGRLAFEYYPAEQLGKFKDLLAITQRRVADISLIAPAYTSELLPLSGASDLPGMYQDVCRATSVLMSLYRPGGIVYEREYKPKGLLPLIAFALVPYDILTSSKRVSTIEDMKGLKIRTTGGATDISVSKLGAIPLHISQSETFESLQRGTLDGTIIAKAAIKAWDLQSIAKNLTSGPPFGSANVVWAINKAAFDELPPDLQKILVKAGEETAQHICNFAASDDKAQGDFLRSKGVELIELPQSEIARWVAALAPVKDDWVKQLQNRGLPAAEVIDAYQKAYLSAPK